MKPPQMGACEPTYIADWLSVVYVGCCQSELEIPKDIHEESSSNMSNSIVLNDSNAKEALSNGLMDALQIPRNPLIGNNAAGSVHFWSCILSKGATHQR